MTVRCRTTSSKQKKGGTSHSVQPSVENPFHRTLAVKFPLSWKSNGSTRLFGSTVTDTGLCKVQFFRYRISLLILLCFHLTGRYAACQVAEWKAILFFSDSDPNYLHWYKTVGFQLLQNYFRLSTNSSITASSRIKAVMASHTFLVNGQQKNLTSLLLKTCCSAPCCSLQQCLGLTTPFLPMWKCWKALLLNSAFPLNASGVRQQWKGLLTLQTNPLSS